MANNGDAERVWFRLLRLHARLDLAVTARLKHLSLSNSQCDVLTTLTEREGIRQQELAKRLYVTKGNISGLLDRLAAAGLVERRAIPGDRRSHAIFLTPEGRLLAQRGIAAQREFALEIFGRLRPSDLAKFEDLLIAVRDLLKNRSDASFSTEEVSKRAPQNDHG